MEANLGDVANIGVVEICLIFPKTSYLSNLNVCRLIYDQKTDDAAVEVYK